MRLFSWADEATEAELLRVQERMARELFGYTIKLVIFGSLCGLIWSVVAEVELSRLMSSAACFVSTLILLRVTRARDARVRLLSLVSGIAAVCALATLFNGGVLAPAYSAFYCLFMMLMWYTSLTTSLIIWSAYICLGILSIWGVESGWIRPLASSLTPGQYLGFFGLFMITMIFALNLIRMFIYSSLKGEHRGRILLETFYDSIDEPMLVCSRDLTLIQVNRAGEALIAQLAQDQLELFNLTVVEDEISVSEVVTTRGDQPLQVQLSVPPQHFELNSVPLIVDHRLDGYIIRVREVSEQIRRRQQMLHVEKLNAIGQVTSSIVHDFSNTLMSLEGILELIEEEQVPAQAEWTELALKTIEYNQEQLQHLLSFARDEPQQMQTVALHELIERSMKLVRGALDVSVKVVLELEERSTPRVITDVSTFMNALINLGLNAAHAMNNVGTLRVQTETLSIKSEPPQINTLGLTSGSYVKVSVSDTGCGIGPQELPHIFEPFYTTKKRGEGTGLGLANLDQFMTRTGGAITVKSVLGEGTRFELYFPISTERSREAFTPPMP